MFVIINTPKSALCLIIIAKLKANVYVVAQAMADWGEIMCRYYGRTSFARDTDVTVNYLGYYTDNGKIKGLTQI